MKYIGSTDGNLCYHGTAAWLGISVGKTHYCMTELIKKGYVKATRFVNSKKKMAYMYQLTPHGIEKKYNLKMPLHILKTMADSNATAKQASGQPLFSLNHQNIN